MEMDSFIRYYKHTSAISFIDLELDEIRCLYRDILQMHDEILVFDYFFAHFLLVINTWHILHVYQFYDLKHFEANIL